jgi:hypothetical protein
MSWGPEKIRIPTPDKFMLRLFSFRVKQQPAKAIYLIRRIKTA